MQTGLEGKPWYVGLAAGLVLGLVLFGLGYWQLLIPMKKEIKTKQATLDALQIKIQEGEAAARELPRFREEVAQLELELEKLLRILPARRNTPDLLRRIRSLAEQGNFDLKRFTPGQLADQDFYSEWPIAIELEGSYHNLALFFDRIGRFSRIINIENLKINAITRPTASHTLRAMFNATTFVYKEPEPVEEEAPAGGSPLLQQGLQPGPGDDAPAAAPRGGGGE
jgi:type IV pilus assembly protein PilO